MPPPPAPTLPQVPPQDGNTFDPSLCNTEAGRLLLDDPTKCDTLAQPSVDSDSDGIPATEDNCPVNYNLDQTDRDGDGIGDAYDPKDDTPLPPVESSEPSPPVESSAPLIATACPESLSAPPPLVILVDYTPIDITVTISSTFSLTLSNIA